jgi:hypothetical protein
VELQHNYRAQELAVIGIDAGEQAGVVRDFVEQKGVNYLNLLGDEDVLRAYRVTGTPLIVLITTEGRIHSQYLGWQEWDQWQTEHQVEQGIQELLAVSGH